MRSNPARPQSPGTLSAVMIQDAAEFKWLRENDDLQLQRRASDESASYDTWIEVINNYPELREWVAHNKTVPIEILDLLSADESSQVRSTVARKRKITPEIGERLAVDKSEDVRYALLCNTKLPWSIKTTIFTGDSSWLRSEMNAMEKKMNNE